MNYLAKVFKNKMFVLYIERCPHHMLKIKFIFIIMLIVTGRNIILIKLLIEYNMLKTIGSIVTNKEEDIIIIKNLVIMRMNVKDLGKYVYELIVLIK